MEDLGERRRGEGSHSRRHLGPPAVAVTGGAWPSTSPADRPAGGTGYPHSLTTGTDPARKG